MEEQKNNEQFVSNNAEPTPVSETPTQSTLPVVESKDDTSKVDEVKEESTLEKKEDVPLDEVKEETSSENKTGLSEEDLVEDKKSDEVTNKKLKKIPYVFFILIIIGIPLCIIEKKYLNGDFNKKVKQEVQEKKKETINKYGGLHNNKEDEEIPGKTLRCSYEGNVSDINDPLEYDMFKGIEEYFDYKVDYTFLLADESKEIERVRVIYTYYYNGPYVDMEDKNNNVIPDEEIVTEETTDIEEVELPKGFEDLYKGAMKKKSSLCGSKSIDYPFYNCKIVDDDNKIIVTYKVSNDTLINKKTIIANNLTFNPKMEFDMLSRAFSINGPNNKQYVCIEE